MINPLCTVYVCLNGGDYQDCLAVLSANSSGHTRAVLQQTWGCTILVWARGPQFSLVRLIILSHPLRKWVYDEKVTLRKLSFNLMRPLCVCWRGSIQVVWLFVVGFIGVSCNFTNDLWSASTSCCSLLCRSLLFAPLNLFIFAFTSYVVDLTKKNVPCHSVWVFPLCFPVVVWKSQVFL